MAYFREQLRAATFLCEDGNIFTFNCIVSINYIFVLFYNWLDFTEKVFYLET